MPNTDENLKSLNFDKSRDDVRCEADKCFHRQTKKSYDNRARRQRDKRRGSRLIA
jgi:hypothetical protein